jgi:hypothetical protein
LSLPSDLEIHSPYTVETLRHEEDRKEEELFRKEHSLINSDETKEKGKEDFDDEEDKEEFWPHRR